MLNRQEIADQKEKNAIKAENDKAAYEADKLALEEKLKQEGLSFKQRRDLIKADLILNAKDRKKLNDDIDKEEKKSIDDHNKAIADLNKKYDDEKLNRLADTAVKKEQLDYERRLAEINLIATTESEKNTLVEKLNEEHLVKMSLAIKTDAEKKAADDKAIEDKKAAEAAEREKQKDSVIAASKQNLNNIIQGLEATGLAKSKAGQAISKALALTQIGIDSAVAISKASTLANAEGVAAQAAFPTVPGIGTIARVVSYASTTLSVLGNIARAKQLLSSGGAGGGSGSSGGGSAPNVGGGANAPQFNVVGNSGVNQLANVMNTKEQPPIKTYVIASDVTSGQSLDRNIIKNASLG
jgi:hypothetical protein